jgi:glycine oxidase
MSINNIVLIIEIFNFKIGNLGLEEINAKMNNIQIESTTFNDSTFDYLILGAGLAGLTLAIELLKSGAKVCLIDINKPGAGASGAPAGLMNPATSQKARMPNDAIECIKAFDELLDFVLDDNKSEVVISQKVLRPAVDNQLENNFADSVNSGQWPSNWIEWLDSNQISKIVDIQSFGGILLHIAKGINFRTWIQALDSKIRQMKGTRIYGSSYTLSSISNGYQITTKNRVFSSKVIIDCTGSDLTYKSNYKMALVKGQTRVVNRPESLNLPLAISSYGYVLSDQFRVVIGSTYEHKYDTLLSTEKHDNHILKKAHIIEGFHPGKEQISERWSGIRVSTPDRIPAIGPSESDPNLFLYFGLGSKGLFYSAYLSKVLANHLIHGSQIPSRYLPGRFLK